MPFEETDRPETRRMGDGWHALTEPRRVQCYIGSTWGDADVTDVNELTREIRVLRGDMHYVLDPGRYRDTVGVLDDAWQR